MRVEYPPFYSVPWTTRDVWLGVVSLGLWWALLVGASYSFGLSGLDLDWAVLIWSLASLGTLVPVWWFALRRHNDGWRKLGLRTFENEMVKLGCVLLLLSFAVNWVNSWFLARFNLPSDVGELARIFAELSSPWGLFVDVVIIAPLVEELFYRGFLFAGLREKHGWQKAALISAALFSLFHFQITLIVPRIILGYLFAYLYHRSNSIWPSIIIHAANNFLAAGTGYLFAIRGLHR
jgi:uncharacterized protein